ncbi:MAG: helix-turn-helix domain-containing protein [Ruminococcus sp.]|nr:helix-turn-helix domain-containing protein [Ruminococcus sp.]MCM1382008.1 helix-turn-helix domain-containing protein [Muribaculaceae bacterium]MCM1478984.1 helix-turn-helix domain-containing protein [Muribaculaceae bacterium]
MNKDFYDYKDIAKILNVSERSARIIMVQREFPSFKLGSKVRVLIKDFDEWFENIKGKEIPIDDSVNKFKELTPKGE